MKIILGVNDDDEEPSEYVEMTRIMSTETSNYLSKIKYLNSFVYLGLDKECLTTNWLVFLYYPGLVAIFKLAT